jgi:hypothetical protein
MNAADEVAALRAEVGALRRWVSALLLLTLVSLASVVLLAVRGFGAGSGWGTSEVRVVKIAAQEYHLLDPDGNLRGLWNCPPAGPSLTLHAQNGRVAAELREVPGKGGMIQVFDAAGQPLQDRR